MNMFLNKYGFEILADLVKERVQDQGYAQCLRSVHLSVSESKVAAGGYTTFLKG